MPLIKNLDYKPPKILFNRHLETIYPALCRKVNFNHYNITEIDTPDEDFLQLDWYKNSHNRVVIISHGLEGNSRKPYVKGMAKIFYLNNWDVIAWNYRGCGTRMNNQKIFYHSGATYDLETVIHFATKYYEEIFLVGFSLGGNLTLKYMAESNQGKVRGCCVFSVPLDLKSCSLEMEKTHNFIYSKRFLYYLKSKIKIKKDQLNGVYPLNRLDKINTLYEFDEYFTAPLHGFQNAADYYEKCNSLRSIQQIKKPSLVINAKNDPFLTPLCYPYKIAEGHEYLFFEGTDYGGHVGFSNFNSQNVYWSEKRAVEFANSLLKQ